MNAMQNCNVLPRIKSFEYLLTFTKSLNPIKHPLTVVYKLAEKVLSYLFGFNLLNYHIAKIGKQLSGKYDTVIAYSEGIAAQITIKIQTPCKIVWIHNDYGFECARGDKGTSFDEFSHIVCVSDATKQSFIAKYPQYAGKTITIYNIINDGFITESSTEFKAAEFSSNDFNIISIGRICYQKNFDIIPSIFSKLPKEIQATSKWYIIGMVLRMR